MKKYITTSLGFCMLLSASARQTEIHHQAIKQDAFVPAQAVTVHIESHKYFLHALPKQAAVAEQYENGQPLYEGHSRNNKLHGTWKSWYGNGHLCDSGTLVKGVPQGEWKHWDANGVLLAVRTYDAGKYHRVKNEMTRYNARRVNLPIVAMYKKNKTLVLNRLSSLYSYPGGEANHTVHSLRQLVVSNISREKTYHPVYEQNLHHGLFMNFFANGLVKDSGYYQNGLRDGVWKHAEQAQGYYWQGAYRHGIKVNEWKYYQPDGRLSSILFYNKRGTLIREKKFR